MKNASVVRGAEVEVIQAPWGTLQWLISARNGSSDAMTVGRVTFKPGQANPRHHHPNCEETLVVVTGQIDHLLPDGASVLLGPGDCVVIPRNGVHRARNTSDIEAVVIVAFDSANRETINEPV